MLDISYPSQKVPCFCLDATQNADPLLTEDKLSTFGKLRDGFIWLFEHKSFLSVIITLLLWTTSASPRFKTGVSNIEVILLTRAIKRKTKLGKI